MAITLFALAVLVFVAVFLQGVKESQLGKISLGPLGGYLALNVVLGILDSRLLPGPSVAPTLLGLGLGVVLAIVATLADRLDKSGPISLALACFVAGLLQLGVGGDNGSVVLGLALAMGTMSLFSPTRTVVLTTLAVVAVGLPGMLASKHAPEGSPAGIAIGALTVLSLLGLLLPKLRARVTEFSLLTAVVGVVALYAIGKICFPQTEDWIGILSVPIIAVVVPWVQRSNPEKSKFFLGVSAILWIGVATIGFGILRAEGIGLAILIVTGTLCVLESATALLSFGPLLALGFHQAFRLLHTGVGGSIDIGQHYSLIGFALAAILPLLPFEWSKIGVKMKESLVGLNGLIWGLICLAAPALVAMFLAPKGLLGFVTGLGFAGFLAWSSQATEADPLALAASISAAAILEYGFMEKFTDLSRSDKIHWFLITGVLLLVAAAILTAVAKLGAEKKSEVTA